MTGPHAHVCTILGPSASSHKMHWAECKNVSKHQTKYILITPDDKLKEKKHTIGTGQRI